MHAKALEEYKLTRRELLEVQDCITKWMDMFIKATAAVAAAAALTYKLASGPTGFDDLDVMFMVLALGFLVLIFSTIVFHKCNTHNRYAGFARAMVREKITGGAGLWSIAELHIWESVLEPPAQAPRRPPKKGAPPSPGPWELLARQLTGQVGDQAAHMVRIAQAVDDCEDRCAWPVSRPGGTIIACFVGGCMLLRGAIYRYKTRSWTYVAQVGFGPFLVSSVCALIAGGILLWNTDFPIAERSIAAKLAFGYVAFTYLAVAWLGIFYRVFRLCGAKGDRTIDNYTNRFTILRALALQRRQVSAVYLSWP